MSTPFTDALRAAGAARLIAGTGVAHAGELVSLCDLPQQPRDFVDRAVTVRGMLRMRREGASMTDGRCSAVKVAWDRPSPDGGALDRLWDSFERIHIDARRKSPVAFACVVSGTISYDPAVVTVPVTLHFSSARCADKTNCGP